jgi:ribosome-binding factor A
LHDPRVRLVTVTAIKLSRDLAHAKVFITQLQEASEKIAIEELVKILNKAAAHLRYHLAQALSLRVTPRLRFVYDASLTQAMHLSALINKAVADD